MKILSMILMSPFIWWIATIVAYNLLKIDDEMDEMISNLRAAIIGLLFLLAVWGMFLL